MRSVVGCMQTASQLLHSYASVQLAGAVPVVVYMHRLWWVEVPSVVLNALRCLCLEWVAELTASFTCCADNTMAVVV